MPKLNPNYQKLQAGYLFPEINRRVKIYLQQNPNTKIFSLGIGNTTQPLAPIVIQKMKEAVEKLADSKTYRGYGDEQGDLNLRQALVNRYARRGVSILPEEIFISDGAKTDAANILSIFNCENKIAVQDPSYPVYIDSAVIQGFTGIFLSNHYKKIEYLKCNLQNNFISPLPTSKVDLIYLCSPNNPTGAVMRKEDLQRFVDYALANHALIIFDAAYSAFIKDPELPRSIYEIPHAKKCAIEINSLSKEAGFTGVRLGWTVVPLDLETKSLENNSLEKVHDLWLRRQCTMFNGASNIAQAGALAALSLEGEEQNKKIINYYMENTQSIKNNLKNLGWVVFGGENAPYLWVKTPNNLDSWTFFDQLLEKAQVVVTPGIGFGLGGECYIRLSAFASREETQQALDNINLVFGEK